MPDLGPDTLLVNAQKVILKTSGDEYVQLQKIRTHIGRPEFREPTTDGGVQYYYGSGDHFFEADVLGTTDQISELNDRTERDANGLAQVFPYEIKATSKSGTVATITVNCVLRDFNQEAEDEGFLKFRAYFRIVSDTVVVT
jgi:hypothetical protein